MADKIGRDKILYRYLDQRRGWLAGVTILLLLAGWLLFFNLRLTSDVAALLPDRDAGRLHTEFTLLARAPLARRIVLRLRRGPEISRTELFRAAANLEKELKPPLFTRVIGGPGRVDLTALTAYGVDKWPLLFDRQEYSELAARTSPARIREALEKVRRALLEPGGIFRKRLLFADPLNFRDLLLPRLAALNPMGHGRVVDGRFLSADGRETLLLIETPVAITDFRGSTRLLATLDQVLKRVLPPGITAFPVCGHRYTVANAAAIQRDMATVIAASLGALLLIFLLFLRRSRALLVFLLPVAILGPALAATGLLLGSLSAITIGFGAVLLGITIDYGIHLYFALQEQPAEPAVVIRQLAPPLLGAGLTTIGAFSVQLFSLLPGQRQLALFAIFGILLALILTLAVLPHFLSEGAPETGKGSPAPGQPAAETRGSGRKPLFQRRKTALGVVLVWLGVMLFCAGSARKVSCEGDLRRVNLVPDAVRKAENGLKKNWGEVRGRALVFTAGKNLEQALALNDWLYDRLTRLFPGTRIVSLAPILPAAKLQRKRLAQWRTFWDKPRLDKLNHDFRSLGAELGFRPEAFAPFFRRLTATPAPLDVSFWRQAGLGALLEASISRRDGRVSLLTLLPDRPGLAARLSSPRMAAGISLVSPLAFNREVSAAVTEDLTRFIVFALLMVSITLLVLLKNPVQILLALLPVAGGLLVMFGVMGALGLGFNLFNLVAVILLIGLGVDYGIFMVYRFFRERSAVGERAVLVSALTTLAGFGVLVLARHPALKSIGLTVLLGVLGALPAVLLVFPALACLIRPEVKNRNPER